MEHHTTDVHRFARPVDRLICTEVGHVAIGATKFSRRHFDGSGKLSGIQRCNDEDDCQKAAKDRAASIHDFCLMAKGIYTCTHEWRRILDDPAITSLGSI